MVSSQFESILKEFELFFNCSLKADENESCLIQMGIGVNIQIELNREGKLLIGCRIATLPLGRFLHEVIKEALKANDFYPPSSGIFGFSHKSSNLILYTLIDPYQLDKNKIESILSPFIAKAKIWSDALNQGNVPYITEITNTPPAPPFGYQR
ncbi:Uncharacterized protein PRO82_000259 [Candidatus Protochlamydia amoebophila]|uniref:CesT family type III secretion system chaperone n=1 Tax=Candidatus Protochlamydia amoebophila TaxID=362787 RepID=UPI001BC931A7|nr:CesT family type III secretion system chaperone [Candidatus Protochlamydia amoebophila]MBS4162978.1 Uncharacterized protein [Candidatus Protochlamydia amoebophila]